jgi:type IV pilus assembly protein PilF
MLLVGILAGVSACGPTLEEKQRRANTQIELGFAELNRGNFTEAFKALERAKKIYPDDPNIYNGLGLISLYQRQYQNAVAEFHNALRLNPNFSDAHNNLGTTYAQMKKWDEAIEEFRTALSDPFYRTPELARYHLGVALMEKGEIIEAVKELHAAVQMRSDFERALDKYGVALFRLNRVQEAVKQFKQAIEANSEYIDPHLNLGLAYMKQGKREEAITEFKIVLERSKDEELTASARRYLEILE